METETYESPYHFANRLRKIDNDDNEAGIVYLYRLCTLIIITRCGITTMRAQGYAINGNDGMNEKVFTIFLQVHVKRKSFMISKFVTSAV